MKNSHENALMQEMSLQDMRKERCWLYLFPQEGQKRLLQRKGENLSSPQ